MPYLPSCLQGPCRGWQTLPLYLKTKRGSCGGLLLAWRSHRYKEPNFRTEVWLIPELPCLRNPARGPWRAGPGRWGFRLPLAGWQPAWTMGIGHMCPDIYKGTGVSVKPAVAAWPAGMRVTLLPPSSVTVQLLREIHFSQGSMEKAKSWQNFSFYNEEFIQSFGYHLSMRTTYNKMFEFAHEYLWNLFNSHETHSGFSFFFSSFSLSLSALSCNKKYSCWHN